MFVIISALPIRLLDMKIQEIKVDLDLMLEKKKKNVVLIKNIASRIIYIDSV